MKLVLKLPLAVMVCLSCVIANSRDGIGAPVATKPEAKPSMGQKSQQNQDATDPVVTVVWPLTFTPETVHSTSGNGTSEVSDRYKIDTLRDALNATYQNPNPQGTPQAPAPIQSARNAFIIHAPRTTALKIKRDLALLDAPGPQVQLDMWAIQMAGKGSQLDEQIKIVNDDLRANRELMQHAQDDLVQSIYFAIAQAAKEQRDPAIPQVTEPPKRVVEWLINQLDEVGFDVNPWRPLTLSEVLIFLAIMEPEDRRTAMDYLDRESFKSAVKARLLSEANRVTQRKFERFQMLFRPSEPLPEPTEEPVRNGIAAYLKALVKFRKMSDFLAGEGPGSVTAYWTVPEELNRQAAAIDTLSARAAEALAADMQQMFLDPLVDNMQATLSQGHGEVSLLGRTRLVVTSGLESGLDPTLVSRVDVTQPAPLNMDDFKKIFSDDFAGKLSKLSDPQIALLGTLLSEPPRTFINVAPGIAINVRPSVLPNAASARLQIDAKFGVAASTPQDQSAGSNPQPPPFDAVQSHHVSTDAIINALDLFGISSFSVDTQTPRTPYTLPVLGRLPILGPMFQLPRKDLKISHHSIILVNTVILPRALDIARFYGKGAAVNAAMPL